MKWHSTERDDGVRRCRDWGMVWDEDESPAMFPPVIVVTTGIQISLFVPLQKKVCGDRTDCRGGGNFAQTSSGKGCKCVDLMRECQDTGWEVKFFLAELRSRELRGCFKCMDLPKKEIRKAIDDISETALRATYTIWLARSDKMFENWELVDRPS